MVSATLYDSPMPAGVSPTLPFVLVAQPELQPQDHRLDAIYLQLESLKALAIESRRDLDLLRQMSADILESVRVAPAVEPAPAPSAIEPTAEPAPLLRVRMLGSFEAWLTGQPLTRWPSRKARLLLAHLAIERGRMVPKDVLIDLFWPDAPAERGSNNLSIAIHQLRTAFARIEPESVQTIVVRQGLYGLDGTNVSVDLWEFQSSLAQARRALERKDDDATRSALGQAVELWDGDLLESDPYEEWAVQPRRSLAAAYNQALAWLAASASRDADWPAVIDFAGRILQRERCDESAHRWLITAYWKLGNRPYALQKYRDYEEALRDELGVGPTAEAQRLYQQILQQ